MKKNRHTWTKDGIKKLVDLWDTATTQEMADKLNLSAPQINYMASQIRKAGYKLAKKRRIGQTQTLIREALGLR